MIDFIIFWARIIVIIFLGFAAIYLVAYNFNSGWQAANYNFWKKKAAARSTIKPKEGDKSNE